ncbi:MAG: hypothetical protein OHM56_05695 [Spiroplasma phoeniceum]|nr:MAG: hypothetical protein OHM56_05695 [Spiroplasma phoeniceum]
MFIIMFSALSSEWKAWKQLGKLETIEKLSLIVHNNSKVKKGV